MLINVKSLISTSCVSDILWKVNSFCIWALHPLVSHNFSFLYFITIINVKYTIEEHTTWIKWNRNKRKKKTYLIGRIKKQAVFLRPWIYFYFTFKRNWKLILKWKIELTIQFGTMRHLIITTKQKKRDLLFIFFVELKTFCCVRLRDYNVMNIYFLML